MRGVNELPYSAINDSTPRLTVYAYRDGLLSGRRIVCFIYITMKSKISHDNERIATIPRSGLHYRRKYLIRAEADTT